MARLCVNPLLAAYGDCLVIKAENDGIETNIIIDGGPGATVDDIVNQLLRIKKVDLLVLTHFDEDHILGLIAYLQRLRKCEDVYIQSVWCNCASKYDLDIDCNSSDAGNSNASKLAYYLSALKEAGKVGEWRENIFYTKEPFYINNVKIDILSPTATILKKMHDEYEEYIDTHGRFIDEFDEDEDVAYGRVCKHRSMTIDNLGNNNSSLQVNLPNEASIAFLLSCGNLKALFLGDANIKQVTSALFDLQYTEGKPLIVNLIKLPHHGSMYNMSIEFIKIIRCYDFLNCTNGGTGGSYHPDRKTLALLAKNCVRGEEDIINVYCNYPVKVITDRVGTLLTEEEESSYHIKLQETNKPLVYEL